MHQLIRIIFGCAICCVGIIVLRHAHLVTGGAPGLALSVFYLTDLPFSIGFIIVNLPFYILSLWRMGLRFTLYSLFASVTLSMMTEFDRFFPPVILPELVGAVIGGVFVGLGLSYLFWNGASLGGVNILVLYLNKRYGINPGKSTFFIDAVIVLSGIYAVV